jgi:hypothetical protein
VAQRAVMIDFGESQVLKRHVPQAVERRIDFHSSRAHLFQ